jgi:hypothetical protein
MKIKKQVDLKDLIFEKVSQEQIFRFYYPYKFTLNQRCLSCFQKENNPSMIIGTKSQSGDIVFKCFNSSHKGDCISFVMQLFNLDYIDSLEKIAEDFGLKESSNIKYEQIIKELPKTTIIKQKKAPDIVVSIRSFNSDELNYWNDYYQDISDLKRENIYVPKKIWINKNPMYFNSTELVFCYYYPKLDKWKIYKPFVKKNEKWLSNVPLQTSWGINNINKENNTIIAKSLKDYMVLLKIYPHIVGVQNESIAAFSNDFVEKLKNNSKNIYYGGDSDAPGKAASYLITNEFEFKHVNPIDELLPDIKDFSDWAKKEGLDKIQNHLINKNIL